MVGRRRGLKPLGPEVVQGLRFVCSDMWNPYLLVIAAEAGQALHILHRIHIAGHLNQSVDEVRVESTRLRTKSKSAAHRLKHMRSSRCAVAVGYGDVPGKSSMLCSPACWPPHGPEI